MATNFGNDLGDGIVVADGFQLTDGSTPFINDNGDISGTSLNVVDGAGNAIAGLTATSGRLPSRTVAQLNAQAGVAGNVVYCTNGNAGQPCLAVHNGTAWLRVVLGAAVAVA